MNITKLAMAWHVGVQDAFLYQKSKDLLIICRVFIKIFTYKSKTRTLKTEKGNAAFKPDI